MQKKLCRSKTNKVLTGFCGGVAEYFGINAIIIRILMLLVACSLFGLVAYFVVSYFIPEEGSDRIEAEFKDNDENK